MFYVLEVLCAFKWSRLVLSCHLPRVIQKAVISNMKRTDKIKLLKITPILSIIAISMIVFVCSFFVKETIPLIPFVGEYIENGKSLLFPFIPSINVLVFLPEEYQVISLTLGHVADYALITNLAMVVNPIAYPFFNRVHHEYQHPVFYDINLGHARAVQLKRKHFFDITITSCLERHAEITRKAARLASLAHHVGELACPRHAMQGNMDTLLAWRAHDAKQQGIVNPPSCSQFSMVSPRRSSPGYALNMHSNNLSCFSRNVITPPASIFFTR
jgi:hypothetical protein